MLFLLAACAAPTPVSLPPEDGPAPIVEPAPQPRALELVSLPSLDHDAYTAHFGPGGTRLATVSSSGERAVRVWQVEEQREIASIPLGASGFDIAPDGETLVLGRKRVATVWSLGRGSVRELGGHWDWVEAVAIHPDGQQVFTYDDTPRFHRFDLRTGRRIEVPPLPEPGGLLRAWVLSSTHLVWAATGTGVMRFDLETGRVERLSEVPYEAGTLAATPDGRWLAATLTAGPAPGKAASGASIGLWDFASERFLEVPGPASAVALTPNGRTLIAGQRDRVWAVDTETGETLAQGIAPGVVGSLSVSADQVVAAPLRGGSVALFRIVHH